MRRARTRRERRAREHKEDRRRRALATAAIAALVAIGLALPGVLAWRYLSAPTVELDAQGCPLGTAPRHVVVVIDQTDELPPAWRAFVRALIPDIAEDPGFPPGSRLTVFGVAGDADAPLDAILSECRPPSPEAGSMLFDTRTERNARRERFDAFYEERIQAAVGRTANAGPREATPLLEAMVALQEALAQTPAVRTDIILVSDMMQYVRGRLNHYASYPDFATYRATPRGARLTAYLGADAVTTYYVVRPELAQHQTQAHRAFWTDYFAAAGEAALTWIDDPLEALAALD